MEIKVNAVVVRSVDYKDNDKILTLYSLERGKITAGIKGVKKPNAKLKFASEPFCFAEYVLAEKNGRFTVINASYIDSFYNLRLSVKKYYSGEVLRDSINSFIEENAVDEQLFSKFVNAVKDICYGENEKYYLAKFLFYLTENLGYGIVDTNCYSCGEVIDGRVFFRISDAVFSCENCKAENFMEITKETYKGISALRKNEEVKDENVLNKTLKFLSYYLSVKGEMRLNGIDDLTT